MNYDLKPGIQFTYIDQERYANCVYQITTIDKETIKAIPVSPEAIEETAPSETHNRYLPAFLDELKAGTTVILDINNQVKEL